MDRRTFLRGTLGVAVGGLGVRHWFEGEADPIPTGSHSLGPRNSILTHPASECPIQTVVVVMMENRSFDHYLGWLAEDDAYLDTGRRRYGPSFRVNGRQNQTYLGPSGEQVSTRPAVSDASGDTRGCSFRSPGHSWDAARRQRDDGFLALGTGNDEFALTYYAPEDLPVYAAMARRFTVFDRWHSSVLGPTFPNRQYLLSAQSEGHKDDPGLALDSQPLTTGIFHAPTILERLAGAGVSTRYYYTNVPLLALWGTERMRPFIHSLDRYFEDAAAGRLPRVVFVEPWFGGDAHRTDDHPRGDVRLGQRWVREVFRAFVESPQWMSGAFILTYDEGGGFFDHVPPPLFPDARASRNDRENFGQGGFRVPALLASPYAMPGGVDHSRYDHTGVMRFLQWRFLGAPPQGGASGGNWSLTLRDRSARNPGATLGGAKPDPELGFDLGMTIPQPTPACTPSQLGSHLPDHGPDPFEHPRVRDLTTTFPAPSHQPWLADVTVPLG